MIITELIEHVEKDEEQIYILKEENGKIICYVVAVIAGEFRTLSKSYDSREQAIKHIKQIELELDVRFNGNRKVH